MPVNMHEPFTRHRVVITGMGALTPVGLTVDDTWASLLAGRSGIQRITSMDLSECACQIGGELKEFDPRSYLGAKKARRMARFSQFAVIAAGMALDDATLSLTEDIRENTGIVMGTAGGGCVVETERAVTKMIRRNSMRVSPFHVTALPPNMASFHIANSFGLRGYSNTVVTACAAGSQAIGEATEVIRAGRAPVMLAGGSEATLGPMGIAGFAAMAALSTRNDDPAAACRPFDVDRDGFVMGEGAAVFVLERLEHAQQRQAHIYAEVLGYAANSDGHHAIAPNPDAHGPIKAIRDALADAGISPQQLDYVNAHGTGTPLGDIVETRAIKEVLGDEAYRVPISATKSMVGHGLGAAGAMETLACLLAIRDNRIHPTINLDRPDPECDLDYVPHTARSARVDIVLKNSFGMGSQNACLVLGRYTP
jgi:3-oxoacyl-[acyl-carrier-protein] synthase II